LLAVDGEVPFSTGEIAAFVAAIVRARTRPLARLCGACRKLGAEIRVFLVQHLAIPDGRRTTGELHSASRCHLHVLEDEMPDAGFRKRSSRRIATRIVADIADRDDA